MRIATRMHTRDYAGNVFGIVSNEEDAVREALDQGTPDNQVGLAMLFWEAKRLLLNDFQRCSHCVEEPIAEANCATLIPDIRFVDVGLGFGPDNEVMRHRSVRCDF